MCVTLDDGMLFTAGEDGTLYIYEVTRNFAELLVIS